MNLLLMFRRKEFISFIFTYYSKITLLLVLSIIVFLLCSGCLSSSNNISNNSSSSSASNSSSSSASNSTISSSYDSQYTYQFANPDTIDNDELRTIYETLRTSWIEKEDNIENDEFINEDLANEPIVGEWTFSTKENILNITFNPNGTITVLGTYIVDGYDYAPALNRAKWGIGNYGYDEYMPDIHLQKDGKEFILENSGRKYIIYYETEDHYKMRIGGINTNENFGKNSNYMLESNNGLGAYLFLEYIGLLNIPYESYGEYYLRNIQNPANISYMGFFKEDGTFEGNNNLIFSVKNSSDYSKYQEYYGNWYSNFIDNKWTTSIECQDNITKQELDFTIAFIPKNR